MYRKCSAKDAWSAAEDGRWLELRLKMGEPIQERLNTGGFTKHRPKMEVFDEHRLSLLEVPIVHLLRKSIQGLIVQHCIFFDK